MSEIHPTTPRKRLRLIPISLTVLASLTAITHAQDTGVATVPPTVETPKAEQELEKNLESFDVVWNKINDLVWDEDFDRKGWQKQRDEIRPTITVETTRKEVRAKLSGMLSSLGKSHFGILPEELYTEFGESEDTGGHSGFCVRMVEGHVTVIEVLDKTDAHAQGIRPGWRLVSYKDKSVAEFVDMLRDSLGEHNKDQLGTTVGFAIDSRLRGEVGEEISLEFLDENDNSKTINLQFSKLEGDVVSALNLPKMTIRRKVEEVAPGIAYQYFSGFFSPVNVRKDNRTARKIGSNPDAEHSGLIIDLRGNGGGMVGMCLGLGHPLVSDKSSYLGTLKAAGANDLKFNLFPRPRPYAGRVAILVDECSASASEILSAGLQAIERAHVFGIRTAGAALPSAVEVLPNKDRFQFAFSAYVDAKGRNIEGVGVKPDVELQRKRADLLVGKDVILQAAIDWIKQQ